MNENKNIPLATEIIRTLKKIIYLLIVLWFLTIAGFIWYMTLPVETTSIEQESDNESFNQVIGGDYSGKQTESNNQETSSEK